MPDYSRIGTADNCRRCKLKIHLTERMIKHSRYLCDECWKWQKRAWKVKPETLKVWTEKNRDSLNQKHRERYNTRYKRRYSAAHQIFHKALREGLIQKQPCEVCGKVAEAHHDDYSKPLEVRWLCKQHHIEADRQRRQQEQEAA